MRGTYIQSTVSAISSGVPSLPIGISEQTLGQRSLGLILALPIPVTEKV